MEKELNNIESLVERLKAKDLENKKLTKSMMFLQGAMVIIYAALFVLNPDPDLTISRRLGGGLYVISFLVFSLYFGYYTRIYNRVNYTVSLKDMLVAAEKRYRPWHNSTIIIIASSLVIGYGTSLFAEGYFPENWSTLTTILICCTVFAILVLTGLYVGHQKWKREQRPIWLSCKQLLKELE